MKQYGTTILLAVVGAALGAYVYFIDLPSAEQAIKQDTLNTRLLPFDYRDVSAVVIKKDDQTISMAMNERYRWDLVAPVSAPVDSREIGNLLRALDLGTISRTITSPATDLKEYGLDPPHMTITLKTDHMTETLLLGDIAPVSSTLYVKRENDDHVLLTSLSVKDFKRKSAFTFRKKEILPFNRLQVDKVTLRLQDQEFVLSRKPAAHGLTGDWQFQSPWTRPADKTAVGLMLMNLESLTATGFIDPGPQQIRLAQQLGVPHMTITLHKGPRQLHVSFFPGASPKGPAYAMRSLEEPIYEINPAELNQLPRTAFDLMDKRLLGMEADDIALLAIKGPEMNYLLIRQHGEWMLEDNTALELDHKKVNLFVSRLANLPVERRIQESEEQLERFGLDHPLYSFTATDTRGRPRGRLNIGSREKGLIYVQGAGLPGVYQARSLILTQIPSPDDLLATQ